jgi:hypothetical protein
MEVSTDLPTVCGERTRYQAEGTKASLSSHDASDVHPEWSGLPTAFFLFGGAQSLVARSPGDQILYGGA